ncbi:MAG: hypothetical protein IPP16_21455 [Acidimicrobiaceae bacterium]|nr:hypothetical protein [Acidimicrobiaceae bacterium]
MSVLVVDVGTSGLRAAVVRPDGEVSALHYRAFPPATPFPGLVEFDAVGMAAAVLEVARASLAEGGPVLAVGITAQRASTIVWDRATGEPVGPGLGWQDLRTVFDCITAKADHGLQLAPNQSATKVAWLLNTYDPGRERDLCFGTVDTWVAWVLSEGQVHVTDHSNAAVTGLLRPDATGWSTSASGAGRACRHVAGAGRHLLGLRRGQRARRVAAARRVGGRPAGQPRRAELRAPGPGEDHLRVGRHARPVHRRRSSQHRQPHLRGHLPHRRLEPQRRVHMGRGSHHALGGHQRRVAGAGPRHPGQPGAEPRRRRALRDR